MLSSHLKKESETVSDREGERRMDFPQTPYTVTVRRNPPRRARPTPSAIKSPGPSSSAAPFSKNIRPFPTIDLDSLSPDKPVHQSNDSNTLQVFLRIRPLLIAKDAKKEPKGQVASRPKGVPDKVKRAKKKMASREINVCLTVNDSCSVTLTTPLSMVDTKRTKTEMYDGFSHVFTPDACQKEVYERVMAPLVSDFLGGKSRLLAAMGPTGSGKTHTVFGSPREPGLVPLALQRIFSDCSGGNTSELPRLYYLSMFEICSERGKTERILDLSPDGGDLCLQQGSLKGLQEMMVSDVTQAECFIARGMLKRATAATNANDQSSRSQCVINIRSASKVADNGDEFLNSNAVMTIVDLAGAEKERRTGNQGTRLLESNFINNTSMVFGLCLRSLLEHQKTKRPLQRHYQNSLLTRYLRDHLEGKKHMTLILTVKPGEEDYLDTSYMLRQSSPYVNIKFNNVEDQSNMNCQKRHLPSIRMEQGKRRKCQNMEASMIHGGKDVRDGHVTPGKEPLQALASSTSSMAGKIDKHGSCNDENHAELKKKDRNDQVMQQFSKALWNVLKQYKKKLEVAENEVQSLKQSLVKEKMRVLKLEDELKDLRFPSSLHIQPSSSKVPSDLELDAAAAAAAACSTGPLDSVQQSDQNIHEVPVEKFAAKNADSFVGSVHEAGKFGAPELSQADDGSNVEGSITSLSQSVAQIENGSCELSSSLEDKTLANVDGTKREACANVSEWHGDAEVPESFVEQNWEIPMQMEGYDVVILDSRLSIEDFKLPGNQGMNQNLHSFLETECGTEDLDGARQLDGNDSSSLVDVAGESSQPHGNSCMDTSSVTKGTLDKEQETINITRDEASGLHDQSAITKSENQVACSSILPVEDVVKVENTGEAPNREEEFDPVESLKVEKSRRRLLPSSSILVKEIDDIEIEVENPKRRGEKKPSAYRKGYTQGNISLVRLLKRNIHV